jgi:hypothetical protein
MTSICYSLDQTERLVQSAVCRMLIREVNAVTELVKGSYESVVNWWNEYRRTFSSKVPQ